MKSTVVILAAFVAAAASAFSPASAESRTVVIPLELKSDAQITAFTDALISAAERVCRSDASPLIGTNVDYYRACRTATLRDTAAKDPTGLLAARLGLASKAPPLTIASK